MNAKKVNIGVVGATGLVGSNIIKVLEEKNLTIDNIRFFASKNSAGKKVVFNSTEYTVEELGEDSFTSDMDIVLFAGGGSVSQKYAPIAVEKGILVVDNSSVFRMHEDVPLVVPEVNGEEIFKNKGIIANPNCSTIQSVLPLKPLYDKYGIKRVIYSTYQAVSGSGLGGIRDLEENTSNTYPYNIVNNALPQIDVFLENGYTKEEMKMINETKKILNDENLNVTATTVRIPVKNCHSISINIELEADFELDDVKKLLGEYPGIRLEDDIDKLVYPMPINADGKDDVFVGRIRRDFSRENSLNMWVVADNIRKGAATNAVQIAEALIVKMKQGEK